MNPWEPKTFKPKDNARSRKKGKAPNLELFFYIRERGMNTYKPHKYNYILG